MRQADDRCRDFTVALRRGDVADKTLVDFDFMHRQIFQVGHTRKTRAKVVDRQLRAKLTEPFQHIGDMLGVLNHAGLGDFQQHHRRIDVPGRQRLPEQIGHFQVEQIVGREVDRQAQGDVVRRQFFTNMAKALEKPAVEKLAQTESDNGGEQLRRRNPLAAFTLPTQQAFGAGAGAADSFDLWLQIKLKSAFRLEGLTDFLVKRFQAVVQFFHIRMVERLAFFVVSGVYRGDSRRLHEVQGILAVFGIHGAAAGRRQPQGYAVDVQQIGVKHPMQLNHGHRQGSAAAQVG